MDGCAIIAGCTRMCRYVGSQRPPPPRNGNKWPADLVRNVQTVDISGQ